MDFQCRDNVSFVSVLFPGSSVPPSPARSVRVFHAEWRNRNVSPFLASPASQWSRRWARRGAEMSPGNSAAQCPARGARLWPGSSAVQQLPLQPSVVRCRANNSPSPAGRYHGSSAPPPPLSAGRSSRRNVSQSVCQSTGAGHVHQPRQHHHWHPHLQPTPVSPQPVQQPVLSKPVMTTGLLSLHLYHHPVTSLLLLLSTTPPHLMMNTDLLSLHL